MDSTEISPTVQEPSSASGSPISTSLRWKIMLMLGLFVPVFFETLDYTVVATAQVHIASSFNRLDLQSYIGTAYLLSSTVFLPLFASIADIWGRYWALQLSLLFFLVGSAISTGSPDMGTMLAGRGVAGVGAAGLQAVVRIILSDSRSLDDNNWQQSVLFFLFSIGYCVGPVIGGALLTVSYRWIFAINLPCCVIGIVLAFFILRKMTKGPQTPRTLLQPSMQEKETFLEKFARVDWFGAALFMAGGILVLLALNWGSTYGWNSARMIACFVVGGVLYIAFFAFEYFLERRTENLAVTGGRLWQEPMLPLAVFRSYDVCAGQFALFVSGMVMIVMFYFVAIFMTIVNGLSSTNAGVQLIYFAPGLGVGSLMQISFVKYFRQPKIPIVLGSTIMSIALGLISMGMDRNKQTWIDGFLALAGVGVGLSIGAIVVHIRFSQPEERIAVVSALGLFFRALGGTIGLAQCGAVLNAKVRSYLLDLASSGLISPSEASALSQAASSSAASLQSINTLPPEVQTLVRDAFRSGSRWCFISLIPWTGISVILTLFLSNIRDTDREAREARQDEETREVHKEETKPRQRKAEQPHDRTESIVTVARDS
ncbi:MFS general substrate transporter [Amylocystis lapponica]|nr:MFS general substrate transporter [Amylocystis lapponica]